MYREEWLHHAVEKINEQIFQGKLDLETYKDYQISCGWCRGSKALAETVFAYDGEDVTMDDFFPITIHVSCTIADPRVMIEAIAHECIHAFFNLRYHNKEFERIATEIGFEAPYYSHNPSQFLKDNAEIVYQMMKKEYGDFPGHAVVIHKKEPKEATKRSIVAFCPDCGYTFKIPKTMYLKHEGKFPICPCGRQMAEDLRDDKNEQKSKD